MAKRTHNSDTGFPHNAIVALAEVTLVALSLGIAVGSRLSVLSIVLAGALVGTLGSCVFFLTRRTPSHEEPEEDKPSLPEEPEQVLLEQQVEHVVQAARPLESAPEIDITPSVTDLDEWELGENPPSTLDFPAFSSRIVGTLDPLAEIKLFVGDIRTREAEGTDSPSPFERYAARLLTEAGLFSDDADFGHVVIVQPPASRMFYLRTRDQDLSYQAKIRLLSLEAALNAIRFSSIYFDDPDSHSMEEHYQLLQKLTHSIAAQSPNLGDGVPVIQDDSPDTEWSVRLGISTAIESFQLPHRLVASWRVNVADGNVAIELGFAPEETFPQTRFIEDLGLVATSREMRRKAASDYALKLALLVAAAAFRCSESIKHVWVAGISQTATRTACYLSVDFDRWRFQRLDLSNLGDLYEVYHSFAATLRYEDNILRPVAQTFSLDERRFCPPKRYEPVSLSSRKIARPYAEALGATRVSGLSIDEGAGRELMAADIMSRIGSSTEQNVRLIMELAGDNPDPSIRSAAERTVEKLIEGTISEDANAVGEEFLTGDPLSQATRRAEELLAGGHPDEAERMLAAVLGPLDEAGLYRDSEHLEHRFFTSYVERTLYNRLFALDGHALMLVPRTYFQAHFLISVAQAMQGKAEEALVHARRLVELAPLDARCYAHLTRCLEMTDRDDEAIDTLNHLLSIAHSPEGLGIAYYRMAFFQWKRGHALAAQACYALAIRYMPAYMPIIAMELSALSLQNPSAFHENLSEDEAEQLLLDQGITIAPTEEMSEVFLSCARASLDAEIFPVARNFAWILGAFAHDDILFGLIRSIEDAPGE